MLISKKQFDSKPAYQKNFMKTKIKSHSVEVTDFYNKEIPKVDSIHTCLAVISLDSDLKKDDSYYPQVFLKECKYSEKKIDRHLHDNLIDFLLLLLLLMSLMKKNLELERLVLQKI